MNRNMKSIVKGIPKRVVDMGLTHDACSSITFAEELSDALRPREAMTMPHTQLMQGLSLSQLQPQLTAHIRQPLHQHVYSFLRFVLHCRVHERTGTREKTGSHGLQRGG